MSGRGYLKAMKEGKYGKDWKEFRKKLIEERGGRCEVCGWDGSWPWVLTVHHIDGNPENRDPQNLMVLCSKCHLNIQRRRKVPDNQLRLL